jgi:hypothetical protein
MTRKRTQIVHIRPGDRSQRLFDGADNGRTRRAEEYRQKRADESDARRGRNLDLLRNRVLRALRQRPGRVTDLFRRFDQDGNGRIDFDEFKVGLRASGVPLNSSEIGYLFNSIDGNGNGEIDTEEFAQFLAVVPSDTQSSAPTRSGRRRSSQLYALGMIASSPHEVRSAVQQTSKNHDDIRRRNVLRKHGMRDFSDFRIVHAVNAVKNAIKRNAKW